MIDARTIFITVTILVVLSLTTVFAKSGGGYTLIGGVVECVSGEGPDTVLSGFVITGGNANGAGTFPDNAGGGMFNSGSSPTVTNCSFSGTTNGVYGLNHSTSGRGILGSAFASTGTNFGVYGFSNSVNGYDFFAAGAGVDYGALSSRRWKNNVVPISDPLYKLAQLRGVYFDWDAEHGGAHDVGMIAEEVGAVLPEIVNYEENGVDANGMDYSKITPLLVEAVNAQQAQIEDLKTQLASMQSIIKQLLAQQSTDTRRATEDSQGANP